MNDATTRHAYPYVSLRAAYLKLSEKKKHLNTMHATGRSRHSIRAVSVKNKREWNIREIILPGENRKIL